MKKKVLRLSLLLFIPILSACQIKSDSDQIIQAIRGELCLIDNKDWIASVDSIKITPQSSDYQLLIRFKDAKGTIRKMTALHPVKTGNIIQQYYLKENRLIFCMIQRYEYQRLYLLSMGVSVNKNDTDSLGNNNSKLFAQRFYFNNEEQLIWMTDEYDQDVLDEQVLNNARTEVFVDYVQFRKIKSYDQTTN